MYAIRKVLAGCLLACASLATAGAPQLLELDRHVPGIRLPGVGGFAIADFDRDGRDNLWCPRLRSPRWSRCMARRRAASPRSRRCF